MSSHQKPSIAKITSPESKNIVLRHRLFTQLDEAVKKPLLWITSPAGSGKTALIASYIHCRKRASLWYQCDEGDADLSTFFYYMTMAAKKAAPRSKNTLPLLTPEYLQGLSTFTRRYFDEIFSLLKTPFVIVLDNYQDISADSRFHEMLVSGLESIPADITVAVISRHEPPAQFARLRASSRMESITWEDIRFTIEETTEFMGAGTAQKELHSAMRDIHDQADGWIAAIVLMSQWMRLYGTETGLHRAFASEKIFDYFAGEIFNKTDAATQEFLLKTSLLAVINVQQAEKLINKGNAGKVLQELHRLNYFTQRLSGSGQDYRYHPLFRDFLLSRATSKLDPQELSLTSAKAAAILAESGNTEEAAALLAGIGDWENLARLITDNARTLIVEGRNKTLEAYLRKFPARFIDTRPVLLYWLGISIMPFNIDESRELLERAFHAFNAQGNAEWALATWAAVVNSILTEHNDYTKLDKWIDWLDGREDMLRTLPSEVTREPVAYMLLALTFRRPWHPKTGLWAVMAEELIMRGMDMPGTMLVGAQLLMHYTFFGEVNKAEFMLKNFRLPESGTVGMSVLSGILWRVITSSYFTLGVASPERCFEAVNSGLDLSREHGIHVFEPLLLYFGAINGIAFGDDAATDGYLQEMLLLRTGIHEMHQAYYLSVLVWRDMMKGNNRSAAERLAMIIPVTEKLGYTINSIANYIGMAHLLFDLGEKENAMSYLAKAHVLHGERSGWLEYMFLLTEAYSRFKRAGSPMAWH